MAQTYYPLPLTGAQTANALKAAKAATLINGIPKYNGTGMAETSVSLAVPNTDYLTPAFIKTISVELDADSWNSTTKVQTVTATGVTASNTVIVAPIGTDIEEYTGSKIVCTTQALNSLTFKCTTIPEDDITVNVLIIG